MYRLPSLGSGRNAALGKERGGLHVQTAVTGVRQERSPREGEGRVTSTDCRHWGPAGNAALGKERGGLHLQTAVTGVRQERSPREGEGRVTSTDCRHWGPAGTQP